jgi:phenylalanyl-tRNA synthetase beta chain
MKFTLKWLNEYVSLDGMLPERIADGLTMLGLEVDSLTDMAKGLEGIVTARITKVRKHPNADRLTVCDVDTGNETVKVVCGAPNAREGMITAIARPGVILPNGLKIRKAKVRGQESHGMLCSGRELGINDDQSGILDIPAQVEPGIELTSALGLDDVLVEIDLTPNRPDCASVVGVAREVAGFSGGRLRKPVALDSLPLLGTAHPDFGVEIREPELCPRYAARKLTGVKIAPSPRWMQQRLLAVGMRPINNIVDITNYVMLELGQPLHAFDFDKLAGGRIIVRCPTDEERTFTTLDNSVRSLEPDMLMICDAERPIAVAGIMGGLESEVTDRTTGVLLESACFNPVSIRRTARRLNISSEASYRFERGIDPNGVDAALERAVGLMVELTGARLVEGGIDVFPGRKPELVLPLRVQRVCDLLGMSLASARIGGYLESIEFGVGNNDGEVLMITVPSFRVDIEREVDLVEEIARLVGYNNIPITLPQIGMDYPQRETLRVFRREVADMFTVRGFTEAINYSFGAEKHFDRLGLAEDDRRRMVTKLRNPLNEDQGVMRSMLLPGLLENLRHNLNHQKPDIALFEIGKVFFQQKEEVQPEERYHLCAVVSGKRYPDAVPLYFSGYESDIFDVKGAAETLFRTLAITGQAGEIQFVPAPDKGEPYIRNGTEMHILDEDKRLGTIGNIAGQTLKQFGIKQDVYFLEMDLNVVNELPRTQKLFRQLPRYPWVKRDIALIVPEDVPAGKLLSTIRELDVVHVENTELFDVYQGKPIEQGMKSVAISVTYRSADRTLDDETVDIVHEKIVNTLMSRFGGRYRE